jgi:hypothetical protein
MLELFQHRFFGKSLIEDVGRSAMYPTHGFHHFPQRLQPEEVEFGAGRSSLLRCITDYDQPLIHLFI